MKAGRWLALAGITVALAVGLVLLKNSRTPEALFSKGVRSATKLVIFEGLPHPTWETSYETEKKRQDIFDIGGFLFYSQPITFGEAHRQKLSDLFSSSEAVFKYGGPKECGGFHPDFAAEWSQEGARYLALLCYGCEEVGLVGPNFRSHHDMSAELAKLREEIMQYRQNRPPSERE